MITTDFVRHVESRGVTARKAGEGWIARCPAHEDHNASLSIAEGQDGRILLKCHAGCLAESIVGALGLRMGDLFADKSTYRGNGKTRIVATYDYVDERGGMLFQTVRKEPKDFAQRRPDPSQPGKWIWNLKGVRRVLYRLPELLSGIKSGRTVFVVEGEKDCDALVLAGFVATCNPMGAGKWQPEHTETLRAASRVVVIADKDEAGRKHAMAVAAGLLGVARSVRVVELPDLGGRPVKDAADFLTTGGTREKLCELVKATADFDSATGPERGEEGNVANQMVNPEAEAMCDRDTFARLAGLPPAEYDCCRKAEAKRLNIRVGTLDREVAKCRVSPQSVQGGTVDFPTVEPWPNPVDGGEVLSAVAATFTRYVALPPHAEIALALWVAHAHAFEAFIHTPRLNLCSPEKGCGKTLVLDVLASLVPRPLRTESITPAVLFRLVELHKPVLLLDEIDTYLKDSDELRGLLNAGHKRGAKAYRCEGDQNQVRAFAAFAPAVLAGIGALPGTLHDRSVVVRLVRAKPGEVSARFDSRRTVAESELCRKLARWVLDRQSELERLDPAMPEGAFNRLADNWRPLFAIAQTAGGDWANRAIAAFNAMTSGDDMDAHGIGAALLADIRVIFATAATDRLWSCRIASDLASMDDKPWPEFKHGKPITPNQLARLLKRFEISSRTVRIGDNTAKGYYLLDFEDAFARFLPGTPLPSRNTVTSPANIGDSPPSETSHGDVLLPFENAVPVNSDGPCDAVTDSAPPFEEKTVYV